LPATNSDFLHNLSPQFGIPSGFGKTVKYLTWGTPQKGYPLGFIPRVTYHQVYRRSEKKGRRLKAQHGAKSTTINTTAQLATQD